MIIILKSEKKKTNDKPMSKTAFRFMVGHFKKRDKKYPPLEKLKKTKIKKGDIVLDYGCGPGSYTIAALEIVGNAGKVYAADIHLSAINEVERIIQEKGLKNIQTILTDCDTKLDNHSINVVLLLDIYHDLSEPEIILKELHRVLKKDGWLTVDDHHLKDDEIINKITSNKLYQFIEKQDEVFTFSKI